MRLTLFSRKKFEIKISEEGHKIPLDIKSDKTDFLSKSSNRKTRSVIPFQNVIQYE